MQQMQETRVQILSQEGPLEKEMATHCAILAWEIHGQWSLAGYSPRGPREVRHDLVTKQQHLLAFSGQRPRIQIKPAVNGPTQSHCHSRDTADLQHQKSRWGKPRPRGRWVFPRFAYTSLRTGNGPPGLVLLTSQVQAEGRAARL